MIRNVKAFAVATVSLSILSAAPAIAQNAQGAQGDTQASIEAADRAAIHHSQRLAQARAFRADEVIVKLKGGARSQSAQAFIGKSVSQNSLSLKGSWSGLNMHHFKLNGTKTVDQAVQDLQNDPAVEYVEPNYIVMMMGEGVEGATMSDQQMQAAAADARAQSVQASAASNPQAFGAVQAMLAPSYTQSSAPMQVTQAWSQMTVGLASPVVAVIDTGLDLTGNVFVNSGAIWTNAGEIAANAIDDEHNGYIDDVHGWNFVSHTNSPQDDNGHGTHVSGIILGITQDISASPIAAAKIKIMPLKFLDSSGSGATSDAVQAIYYATNNGAKILSNSWGGGGFSASLLGAISYSYDAHCLFIAAAGNASGNNDSTPTYPANYNAPGMIAVAATNDTDGFASFSNYGALTVNLGAPGVSILSTLPGNTWAYESGTSMATPMVAGIAALMLREKPTMFGYQMRSIIFGGNDAVASLNGRTTTQGRVNAYSSIFASKAATVSATQPSYDPASYVRLMASVGATPGGGIGGCGTVATEMLSRPGYGDADGGGFGFGAMAFLCALLLAPVVASVALRSRSGRDQRKHERFSIASEVRMMVGDRELVGSVSSISLGGAQINAEAWLEQGGVVTMKIASPDGKEEIEVQGKVVWNEENKRYGVAFSGAGEGALSSIAQWTAALKPN